MTVTASVVVREGAMTPSKEVFVGRVLDEERRLHYSSSRSESEATADVVSSLRISTILH